MVTTGALTTAGRDLIMPAWGQVWSLTWPLAAGGLIGGAALWLGRRPSPIPPGDGIVCLAALGRRGLALAARVSAYTALIGSGPGQSTPWKARLETLERQAEIGDDGARREAGFVFLAFVVLIAGLLIW